MGRALHARMLIHEKSLTLVCLLALAGCAMDGGEAPPPASLDNDPPLAGLDEIVMGAPSNDELPEEGKADAVYPPEFNLADTQSPVRSQQSRGVCSIFSAVGLMEHLYVAEGTITEPDFSEQFLQWSVKNEVGAFRNTSGSSSEYNLQAINRFGIVEEQAWPYEGSEWGEVNDPECKGDSRPTRCYTNGEPPEAAMMAERFQLPPGRFINSRVRSIKGHMVENETAVVVGGTFYYQAWNHRRSPLPTSSEYFAKGYVLAPNAEDLTESVAEGRRAGHSFVLLGWDDELEVQKRDAMGNGVVDADNNPVMEKGFFLFKNSWGTGSFGVENPFGAGYGWISYEYVERYLTAYVSGLPTVTRGEVCGDGEDNDGRNGADCADPACASNPACMGGMPAGHYTASGGPIAIPDNSATGVESTIQVTDHGTISSLSVTVDITHSYRGDLKVVLVHGDRQHSLHDRAGGSQDNLQQTFVVDAFDGEDVNGAWKLVVTDTARADTGSLVTWSMDATF